MKHTKSALKEKIILATLECIEKKGIQAVTVRDIAQQAEVNVAAVSYYFGSKENLLDEALKFSLYSTLSQNVEEAMRANPEPRQLLRSIFLDIFQGALRFPNLTNAHIYAPIVNNDYNGVIIGWLNEAAAQITDRIEKSGQLQVETDKFKMALAQMISNVMFWSIAPDMFNKFLGVDFRDPVQQNKYIDILLDRYLGDE